MTRRTALLFGLLAFVVFCYWCVRMHAPMIQSDIGARSSQVLAANSISGGNVRVDGRDVTLIGPAGSPAISPATQNLIAAVPGVRTVDVESIATGPAAVAAPGDARTIPAKAAQTQAAMDSLLTAQTVEFNPGSAVLTKHGRTVLDSVAPLLKASPALFCEIQGHTDSLGNAERNRDLSYRRAVATRNYLVNEGIQAERLTAKGVGAAQPIASNDTAAGRRRNRRIQFLLKETPQ